MTARDLVSRLLYTVLAALFITSCAALPGQARKSGGINVVATTTIVGDVVKNIGGSDIQLTVLIPANVDEHGYEPTPQDIAKISQADLVFINGAGLEPFIERLTRNAGGSARLVPVSDGITLLQGPQEAPQQDRSGQPTAGGDPHVWMDPNNTLVWVDNIEKALSEADPQHAASYRSNAERYRQQLHTLDQWIQDQVRQVPQNRRELVTDHLVFTYFAKRYSFAQAGAVVPGYSTLASPSAQELAALEDHIQKLGVQVIFVGNTVNPALSERVAKDTHTKLVFILTGSLTGADGPAPTYIDYMKYNVNAVVSALK